MSESKEWLQRALRLGDEESPFPWQEELLKRFVRGEIARSVDIPTGLGKTAVIAIWLVARAIGGALPRRLVYVVDRRAVVDQATEVAEGLREFADNQTEFKQALGLEGRALPISTLRGQHVDNKEWLEDPASPAIIVGTVDMIGSRLLFEGYGTSRKMRPYHAGLLGADTLVVLDEAHLVPPFERLLDAIADGGGIFGAHDEGLRRLVPTFKLMSLSATGRVNGAGSFGLLDKDLRHPIVRRRLDAPKRLTVLPPIDDGWKLEDALAEQAWKLTESGKSALRIIVFCHKREVAEKAKTAVEKLANGDKKQGIAECAVDTELFVGGRRVFERELVAGWLEAQGFIAGKKVNRTQPAFVFATSAGEVGVNLDADHMVSDLVAWERMVQRLGRVNRRGDGAAHVIVIAEPPSKAAEKARSKTPDDMGPKDRAAIADAERKDAVCELIRRLPNVERARDGSPGALRQMKLRAKEDPGLQALLDVATTPAPLRPALSRALVDAWSMTSLKEHTGRPEIGPWLRGWQDDPPQTSVVWRTYLPVRTSGGTATKREIEGFFEAAPSHTSELLETETYRVVAWLVDRAKELFRHEVRRGDEAGNQSNNRLPIHNDDVIAIALTPAGDFVGQWRLADLAIGDDLDAKKRRERLEASLNRATLVVDARIGGLNEEGLLDHETRSPARTADDGSAWMPGVVVAPTTEPGAASPIVGFRVIAEGPAGPTTDRRDRRWLERFRFAAELSDDGEPQRSLIVQKWRDDAATEEDRSEGRPQLLDVHQKWAEARAKVLAVRLGLPEVYAEMLSIVARVHDEGKRTSRWQRAFNANHDGFYAKTRGPINFSLLDGYRHEFGTLLVVAKDARLRALPEDLYDLALHLIAAHHGFARPVIGINGCEDLPPSGLEEQAQEVALRFARLQRRWGPWGLAWWESLLRAADQQASRENDNADEVAEPPLVQSNA
jgi:CRISPR-associated endonuclease/helicase Cas3